MRVVFRCDPALLADLAAADPGAAARCRNGCARCRATAFSETHGIGTCARSSNARHSSTRCRHGFVIPLPCDIHVRDGVLSWDWDHPPLVVDAHPTSPLSFHDPAQAAGAPLSKPDVVIVKFNSFWTIELEPGYSLFATHPVNRADLPFRLLTGLVDCDRFNDVGVLFPAVWIDPEYEGVLPRGTPVAQCFPVAREALDMVCEAFSADDARRYRDTARELLSEPGTYRRKFRVKRERSSEE